MLRCNTDTPEHYLFESTADQQPELDFHTFLWLHTIARTSNNTKHAATATADNYQIPDNLVLRKQSLNAFLESHSKPYKTMFIHIHVIHVSTTCYETAIRHNTLSYHQIAQAMFQPCFFQNPKPTLPRRRQWKTDHLIAQTRVGPRTQGNSAIKNHQQLHKHI